MSKEKYRGRVHMLLLYPDNPEHKAAMEKIAQSYDYAAILHDRDKWTEEDEKKNPEHKAGVNKKAHWHVVLRFNQAVWNTATCKELGIDTNYIEQVKRFENALQYLIHYNDNDKAQYSTEEVFGNLAIKLRESINKTEKTEGEKVAELIAIIRQYDGRITVTEFAEYCAANGYWAEFRRSGSIFMKIIDEHNQRYNRNAED